MTKLSIQHYTLCTIATQQSIPMEEMQKKIRQFFYYCASQEDAVLTYEASDMVLAGHSEVGYLNKCDPRNRARGHHYL